MLNIPLKVRCHLPHKFSLIFGAAAFAQIYSYDSHEYMEERFLLFKLQLQIT